MAIMEIVVSPRGEGTSVSRWMVPAMQVLDDSGLRHETHAMGTNVEGAPADLFALAQRMHEACVGQDGVGRVVTTIKIDDRLDKPMTFESKLASLQSRLRRGSGGVD
jgi:uncharacterized protein (TIGR00106 family)